VQVVSYCKEIARADGQRDKELLEHLHQEKIAERGLDPNSIAPSARHTTATLPAALDPLPEHQIPAFQSPRTPEIADFFQHDLSESSPIEPAASKDEEHPDLNLDLCISLPSSFNPRRKQSFERR
jgi:hypothetical protein